LTSLHSNFWFRSALRIRRACEHTIIHSSSGTGIWTTAAAEAQTRAD